LRGGLALDLLFITGEYNAGVDTDNDGVLEEHEMVPLEFMCPITGRPMTSPVKAADGNSYEKKAIQGMFSTNERISPVTGERMANTRVVDDVELQERIEKWVHMKVEEEQFHDHADKDGDGITSEEEIAREWARRHAEKYGDGHQAAVDISAVKFKFFQLDKDKSGELDGEEAVALAEFILQSFGIKGKDAREEAVKLIQQLDQDSDGHIGFDEFEKFYEEKAEEAKKFAETAGEGHINHMALGENIVCQGENWEDKICERIYAGCWVDDPESIFHMLDKDKTGRVTCDNLNDMLQYLEFPGASKELAQSMLDDVDGQHDASDGQITMQEFKRSFKRSFLEPGEGRKFVPKKEWANPAKK